MTLILSGSDGLSDVDGSAATPAIRGTDANTGIFFPAADTIAFSEGGAEAMRLNSSGSLGLGTTTPTFDDGTGMQISRTGVATYRATNTTGNISLEMKATGSLVSIASRGSYPLLFEINGAEVSRFDSSGNLLVGTTSGSGNNERLNITSSTNQTARFINTNATSGNISIVSTLGANTDNTNSYHILTATNGATRFYVYGNGTSGNASDKNLKKNIETTRDGYAEDLCKLRVVKYNWNGQADGSPKELGWIAQEVEQVFPNLVQDGIPNENGERFKEVKTSVLPFMLLKAIQEQQAIITQLQADVAALKAI